MSKLVAYSDDEDDGGSSRVTEDQRSVANGQPHDNGEQAQARAMKAAKHSNIPLDDNDRASTSTPRAERHGLLHLLAPPPRLLPPESPGGCFLEDSEWGLALEKSTGGVDEALSAKLANFHKLKEEQETHFNQSLNRNRSFRNPHIYSKLVQWVGVEETGSAYTDMIKGGKKKADEVWASSEEARGELIKQGGKDVIAALQRKRQEEADERKKKSRRENIDFVGSNSSPKVDPTEAKATAESRAKRIREDMTSRGHKDRDRNKDKERDKERDRHRSSSHRH